MTILILLVLVVLLWLMVLAPSAWRRYVERRGVGSIDSFHHQLQLLEHAGPKTVAPAYRLHTAMPSAGPPEVPAAALDSSRPKLVLLRATADSAAADVDDREGSHYERVGVLDRPDPVCVPETGTDLPAFRREQARRRCTTLLRCLCGVAISTGLIGLFPRLHLAWVFTGLAGVAALGLLGLMAYAKEIETEQQRRAARRLTQPGGPGGVDPWELAESAESAGLATAGYPGAWDDEDEVPQAAAR